MPEKYVAANSYSDAELLALYREAAARLSVSGQTYQIAGRMYTAADLDKIWEMIERLEARIAAASATPGSKTNLAKFGRR